MREQEYQSMYDLEEDFWWYRGMRNITEGLLAPYLDRKKDIRILDAGCGTAYSILWMSSKFPVISSFGTDISLEAARFWKDRGFITGVVSCISEIPFPSAYFDLVTVFDVIYQLTDEQQKKAISELQRVLKSGGLIYIREPAYDWLRGAHDIAVATKHRFTRKEIRGLLEGRGFQIIKYTYANTFLFPPAVIHRLLSRTDKEAPSDVKKTSAILNTAFSRIMKFEAVLLKRISFPFGLSTISLAKKI
jgi:ubiquinone/menaquinone biosynthesis C-methylase UbiE